MPTINPNDPFVREVFMDIGTMILRGMKMSYIHLELIVRYGFGREVAIAFTDKFLEKVH